MKKDTIAWECPSCGHRHLWTWPWGKASAWGIKVHCSKCGFEHVTEMVRIGRRAWSVLFEGKK